MIFKKIIVLLIISDNSAIKFVIKNETIKTILLSFLKLSEE